jgi:hypothetical protein
LLFAFEHYNSGNLPVFRQSCQPFDSITEKKQRKQFNDSLQFRESTCNIYMFSLCYFLLTSCCAIVHLNIRTMRLLYENVPNSNPQHYILSLLNVIFCSVDYWLSTWVEIPLMGTERQANVIFIAFIHFLCKFSSRSASPNVKQYFISLISISECTILTNFKL